MSNVPPGLKNLVGDEILFGNWRQFNDSPLQKFIFFYFINGGAHYQYRGCASDPGPGGMDFEVDQYHEWLDRAATGVVVLEELSREHGGGRIRGQAFVRYIDMNDSEFNFMNAKNLAL